LDVYKQDIFEILDSYEALEAACTSDEAVLLKIRSLKKKRTSAFFAPISVS
jgi:hypothetical protein